MAIVKLNSNMLLSDLRGHIGKQLVIKQYGDKIVVAAYPRKSKKKPSRSQNVCRTKFQEAVAQAKAAIADPETAAYYNKIKLEQNFQSAYHAALSDFLK